MDVLGANLLVPILISLYGPAGGGQFALVQRVLAVPTTLIAASVADSFHSRFAIHARENPGQMLPLFKRTSLVLMAAGLPPALLLIFAGNRLFALAFGASWSAAGTLAAIATPFFLGQMIVSPLSRLVLVLRGQRFKLIYDVVVLSGIVTVFRVASSRGFTLTQTVWAFTIVNTMAYLLYYLVLVRIVVTGSGRNNVCAA